LLGDLVEQAVHYVRSKGHTVLCASRACACELCEKAAESDDVSDRRVEYYAASFVRRWTERTFEQRVAVFSAAAGEDILRHVPLGSQRGVRVEVRRYAHGSSSRMSVKPLDGLPKDFPSILPAAFDLVPFIRARYGKRQDPRQPLVFLPPFKCERPTAAFGRPRHVELSVGDFKPTEEAIDTMRKAKAFLVDQDANGYATSPTCPPVPSPGPAADPSPADPPDAAEPDEPTPLESPAEPVAAPASPQPSLGSVDQPAPLVESVEVGYTPAPRRERTAEEQAEAQERKRVHAKPAAELTAQEAVRFDRIADYVTEGKRPQTIPFPKNGQKRKGGGA
jgi:hypothetical protein